MHLLAKNHTTDGLTTLAENSVALQPVAIFKIVNFKTLLRWKYSKGVWMWFGDTGRGEHRDAWLMVGLNGLRDLFQLNDPMIL